MHLFCLHELFTFCLFNVDFLTSNSLKTISSDSDWRYWLLRLKLFAKICNSSAY